MISVTYYIDELNASGIVIISSEWREESKGYQDEHTDEEAACIIDGRYMRVSIYKLMKMFKGTDYTVKKNEISKEKYEEYKLLYGVVDTPEVLDKIERRNELRRLINAEEKKTTPKCPKCKSKMSVRSGKRGIFWSCNTFPSCYGTRDYNQLQRVTVDKLKEELFKIII
ncbi:MULTISPECIES: topoisomerase DNA-binding C4 zinc finger domain-containing protein [unclassified Paenibacillus]|uniref:topoisomerase DNA-binding C4 zinc finger domain-containing protein n=1 Tax=unclassified Paenibacillus TaxID=185978 RepID=UPI0036336999